MNSKKKLLPQYPDRTDSHVGSTSYLSGAVPFRSTLCLLLVAFMMSVNNAAAAQERIAIIDGSFSDTAKSEWLVSQVQQVFEGHEVRILPAELMGGPNEIVAGLRDGVFDMALLPVSWLPRKSPEVKRWNHPFLYVSPTAVRKAFKTLGGLDAVRGSISSDELVTYEMFPEAVILGSTFDCPSHPDAFWGRKVAAPLEQHRSILALGATPFFYPAGESLTSIEKGQGSLTLITPNQALLFHLERIVSGVPDPVDRAFAVQWLVIVLSEQFHQVLQDTGNIESFSSFSSNWVDKELENRTKQMNDFKTTVEGKTCKPDSEAWLTFARNHLKQQIAAPNTELRTFVGELSAILYGN